MSITGIPQLVMQNNSLPDIFTEAEKKKNQAMIIVIRNTELNTGNYLEDTGENACDSMILYSPNGTVAMQGRTYPNKSYIDKYMQDGKLDKNERFNYIAPSFVANAFVKGWHKAAYPALVQKSKFPVIRSIDEMLGDEDDYMDTTGWPADNFHGWLKSLGCETVAGNMGKKGKDWKYEQLTGDWKDAYDWIYKTNKNINTFHNLVLSRKDFENPTRKALRYGSKGEAVKQLQEKLNLTPDGDFGMLTLKAVTEYQDNTPGIFDMGIWVII